MDDPLAMAIDQYLASIPTTLWGQAWDISDPRLRQHAAQWMAGELKRTEEARLVRLRANQSPQP